MGDVSRGFEAMTARIVRPLSPAERERLERGAQRRRQYGDYEVVPAVVMYRIMNSIIRPDELGFTEITQARWARRQDGEHVSLLEYQRGKGTTVRLIFGISASYVPLRLSPKVTWPRTLKAAAARLWVMGSELSGDRTDEIDFFSGEHCVKDDTGRVWGRLGDQARRFWESTSSPEGLRAAAVAQLEQPHELDPIKWPRQELVAAFALARLGDLEKAGTQLQAGASRLAGPDLRAAEQVLARFAPG